MYLSFLLSFLSPGEKLSRTLRIPILQPRTTEESYAQNQTRSTTLAMLLSRQVIPLTIYVQ